MAKTALGTKERILKLAGSGDRDYTVALAAFNDADFVTCRALLDITVSPAHASAKRELLAARLARIEGDVAGWKLSARRAVAAAISETERLSAHALLGLAERADGKNVAADRVLASIAASAPCESAYPGYLCAFDAWHNRDYDRADQLVRNNLRSFPRDAETLSLLGWIDVKRERFKKAGAAFARALARGRESDQFEARLRARLIHAVAMVASDTADIALGRKALREYEAFTWPASLGVEHFNTLTCLRLSALVAGDVQASWFFARDAVVIAPSDAYRAIGETNAAVATALLGDRNTAALQMQRAWDIVRKIRWSDADAEQRVALTNFACEGARSMPNEARRALMLYISLRGKRNRANSLDEDRRIVASETWAAARVAEAIGEKAEAEAHYRSALEVWQSLGFIVRAAAVATDLRRITRKSDLSAVVDELAAVAPNALLVRNSQLAGGILDRIPPAQRRVLAGILRGDDAKTIARDLGRSRFTIDNHTRKIFKTFGVHLRADVRQICRRDGITPESLEVFGVKSR